MKSYACAFGASVVVAASAFAGDPVEWPIASGGNGHWYGIGPAQTWTSARDFAVAQGGHLVTLQTQSEWDFAKAQLSATGHPYWLGMFQDPPTGLPPALGWRWVTDEPFRFTAWDVGEPNDWLGYQQWVGQTSATGEWDDTTPDAMLPSVIEWSADCNGDGVVDFGQIRAGQLADANADNIPDVCQCPTPHVVRVPQDAPSIAAAVALACPNNPMEIVLSPGTWPMAIDTGNPELSFTIRGLEKATCIVTAGSAGTELNARYGSEITLKNLTVADLTGGKTPSGDLGWDVFFEDCVVRNSTGTFLFTPMAPTRKAAFATRFESCSGWGYGFLYLNGAGTVDDCDFVGGGRAITAWGTSTITNNTFAGLSFYGVDARDSFQMSGCDFTSMGGPAIVCNATAPISAAVTVCNFTGGLESAIVDTSFSPVYNMPGGAWDISSSVFSGNTATLRGGAMRVGINRVVTLTNSQFINNSTSSNGGAFSQEFGGQFQSIAVSGCLFIGNSAPQSSGGALDLQGLSGSARITNSNFVDNLALEGGAIAANRTSLDITFCDFDENEATQPSVESGGAVLISISQGRGDNRIRNCNFRNNTAAGRGGAISYYYYVSTDIEDCLFSGNAAAVGGALSIFDHCDPSIRRCSFTGNTAWSSGQAVMVFGAPGWAGIPTLIDACRFSNQPTSPTGVRALDAWTPTQMGATSFCASGLEPYSGQITEISPNCVALSCADDNANGVVDECEGVLSAIRVPLDYPTIQAAIDSVPAGVHRDIFVLAGTYNESFALNGKDVVVRGVPGGGTILDGTGLTSAIARFAGEPATAGVQDLVFRNGTVGSRIFPEATYEVGGAIYANQSGAFIRRCEFRQNRSDFGGAAYLYKCSTLIEDSLFTGNTADEEGGAVMAFESTVTARGTAFVSNQCGAVNPGSGSGFKSVGARVAGETSLLENCSFTGGTAGVDGAAVEHFENTVSVPGSIRIVNTQITGNSTGVRAGGLRVIGRMQSCVIVAGTTICGNANRNVDGPFFIEGSVSICDCLADVAVDGSVNGGDLGLMLNAWGITNSQGTGDVNHNGVVNGEDLSILLSAWGGCS